MAGRPAEGGGAGAVRGPPRLALAPLEKEKRSAEIAEEQRALRTKLQRVERRAREEAEASRKLAAVPAIDRAAVEAIRRATSAVDKLESSLEAGRLSVIVAARGEMKLVTQEDFGQESARSLKAGEIVRLRAGSRARLVHKDMEIEVRSGDPEADARAEKLAAARRALTELLGAKGVTDLAQAEERARAFDSLSAELAAARRNLAEELGDEALESLRARGAELGPVVETRPLASVTAELATLKAEQTAETQRLDRAPPAAHPLGRPPTRARTR